jgi:hypothetical protein
MDRVALCVRFTNDVHLDVMRVPFEKLLSLDGVELSSAILARVEAARDSSRQATFESM